MSRQTWSSRFCMSPLCLTDLALIILQFLFCRYYCRSDFGNFEACFRLEHVHSNMCFKIFQTRSQSEMWSDATLSVDLWRLRLQQCTHCGVMYMDKVSRCDSMDISIYIGVLRYYSEVHSTSYRTFSLALVFLLYGCVDTFLSHPLRVFADLVRHFQKRWEDQNRPKVWQNEPSEPVSMRNVATPLHFFRYRFWPWITRRH